MDRIKLILLALLMLLASTYALSECQEIKGENLSLTLDNNLDAQGETCFYIEGINITFNCRNYLIYNASTAILVNNSHIINLYNCRIENSMNGIVLQVQTPVSYSDQYNLIIMRNTSASLINITINNATNGILFNRTHLNTVRFANVRNSENAVSLFYSYANIIENSTFTNNQLGVFIYDAAPNSSQQNITPIPFKSAKGVKSIDPLPGNQTVRGKYGSIIRHSVFQNNSIGLKLNQTANNSVYNNIFNNTQNVLSDSSSYNYINYWNSSYECVKSIINGLCRGGNYWNDYYGYDDGSGLPPHDVYFDDVGDTLLPYIPSGEVSGDELPLTKLLPPDWIAYCRNITEPGYYTQKRNIYGVISFSNRKCIEVLANNVVINCNGFNITDNTTYTNSYGVYISNYANLTLANCTIQNYTTGLYERNSSYGALFKNNFSNDRYNLYFDVEYPYPSEISQFEKNITTDNYVYGRKVYYFVNGRTGDGYTYPAPPDAGFVAVVNDENILATGYELYNNSPAMMFVNISSLEIKNNKIWKSGVGVYTLFATDVYVHENNFTNNSIYEVFIIYTNVTNISKNLFYNTSGYSMFLYNCSDNVISFNNATNSGFFVYGVYGNNTRIHNNYVNYSSGGVRLSRFNYNWLYENEFWLICGGYPYDAIMYILDGNYTYVYSNTGSARCSSPPGPQSFLVIMGTNPAPTWAYYGEVYNNTIKRHPGSVTWNEGIHINRAGNFSVYNNYLEDFRRDRQSAGIQFPYGAGHVAYNNTVVNASVCFRTFVSNAQTFNNTFMHCDTGVHLESSTGNRIYNNYISNCTIYGYDTFINGNFWNLPAINCSLGPNIIGGPCWGGNYYSNYTGCDGNGDGIGETSYLIIGNAGARDYFPLTNTACKSSKIRTEPIEKQPSEEPVKIKPAEPKPAPVPPSISPEKTKEKNQNSSSISLNLTQVSLPFSISIH